MPRALIAGNWKMHKTVRETVEFVRGLKEHIDGLQDRDILVAPPYTALHAAAAEARGSRVRISAQNMHWEGKGAFTGEISAGMLVEAGCSHVIVGHSERRRLFGETDAEVNLKITAGLQAGLQIIFCIGESLEEREAQQTFNVIKTQLNQGLKNIPKGDISRISVAYEPVWAIGTGKTASPEQAEEAHAFIRSELAAMYSGPSAAETRIVYGGSVTPENIRGLMAEPDVNGALVGGASLDLGSFVQIARF